MLPNRLILVPIVYLCAGLWLPIGRGLAQADVTSRKSRPNILVVMVDDLGFSDLGCYGSEIETPNLDRLAADGVRFSQFYNTAKCHSSRISLLTGLYAIQAGDTALTRGVTSAEVLQSSGYQTAMVGKWHLKKEPTDFGFRRYFGHLSGACNYFTGDNTFRLNGQPWAVPDKGFYTTVANVDFALQFLDEARATEEPWYLYVAFNAPHAPLQPLQKDYEKYLGQYDVGWDVIRKRRLAKQKAIGLFGTDVTPSDRPDHIPAWESLSEKRKTWESRRMAAYAGMIDRVDQELGRLIEDLESKGELDNTFVLFVSDNGACPYDRRSSPMDAKPYESSTRWSDSTGWAWARNAPFRFYKQNQYEGGIATPGIVHWPAGTSLPAGSIRHDPVHLIDVLPTLAEISGATVPEHWPERDLQPLAGTSFATVLRGGELDARPPIHLLFSSDRGLRIGPWKIVSFRNTAWELYHIPSDRTELTDVADKHPDIARRMIEQWHDMAENVLKVPERVRTPVSTQTVKFHREWTDFDRPLGTDSPANKRRPKRKPNHVRARIDTRVTLVDGHWTLDCQGTDSGIAIDHLQMRQGTKGPFRLTCEIESRAGGSGEIYFTIDSKTKLPSGTHVPFSIRHDGQWQTVNVALDTAKSIAAIRFDPCSEPGIVRIREFKIIDSRGDEVFRLPDAASGARKTPE